MSDDGNWTALSSVTNNANAEMPRAYHEGNDGYGDYYNWYAATAETGTFAQASGNASDSLCPAGWQLPINGGSSISKSWQGLLFGSYGLSSNTASSRTMRQNPLSITLTGQYYWINGTLNNRGSYGVFWSSVAHSDNIYAHYLYFTNTAINSPYANSKAYGLTVRCVQK